MNPIMWMHQICINYFIRQATALGRLSQSRPEEFGHAYLRKYSMLCVGGRSHGRCVIAVFLQSFKWGSVHPVLLEIKMWSWRYTSPKLLNVCEAPHVRQESELNFYDLTCLQVVSQTWQIPLLKLSTVQYSTFSDLPLTRCVSFASICVFPSFECLRW